ncbi:MAG TPA: 3-carboxy-cis,cis-muconate cycloisomerase [Candidatus Angelobacter sp.]|nr:3-carboxy-cis,cis-muconate cycloisomerase [Candidatus Angelobacter sp.]
MAVRLIECLSTTGPLADLFSDESILHAMLQFEMALARVEAKLGVIPHSAATTIKAAAHSARLNAAAIASEAPLSGTFAIPFLHAFKESIRAQAPEAAGFVHWGATSQDLCDTALVLLLQKAEAILDADLSRLEKALRKSAQQHRHTVMLGRTWLQAGPPITFGLKVAGWLGAVHRSRQRLAAAFDEALVLQFGGAVGTLAALGKDGLKVAEALADELKLACPEAPWHTHRDRLATLVCACGVLTGTLGKIARDVALLAQNEVGEVSEASAGGRGGSSTMPHKNNPVGSVLALAAAQRVPGLVSNFLSSMVQEHERAAGGWQAEWAIIADVIQNTGFALASMADVAEGLIVDADRMKANIAANHGLVFAERASMLLGKKIDRDRAHQLLKEASARALGSKRNLSEVLAEMPEVEAHLRDGDLRDLENPEHYLGSAEEFRRRLLAAAAQETPQIKSTRQRPASKSTRRKK